MIVRWWNGKGRHSFTRMNEKGKGARRDGSEVVRDIRDGREGIGDITRWYQ